VSPEELLKEGLRELGILAGEDTLGAFLIYLEELKRWNRSFNLTSLKDDREIVIKHFLDSALFLKAIEGRGESIADVGSGAGFPGIPLKILKPRLRIALIEPSGKKSAFLKHMKRKLSLGDLDVIDKRIEEMEGSFDIALTRALFKAPEFIKKARHIVEKGGFFILGKGPAYEKELKGLPVEEIISPALPFTKAVRHLIIIRNA